MRELVHDLVQNSTFSQARRANHGHDSGQQIVVAGVSRLFENFALGSATHEPDAGRLRGATLPSRFGCGPSIVHYPRFFARSLRQTSAVRCLLERRRKLAGETAPPRSADPGHEPLRAGLGFPGRCTTALARALLGVSAFERFCNADVALPRWARDSHVVVIVVQKSVARLLHCQRSAVQKGQGYSALARVTQELLTQRRGDEDVLDAHLRIGEPRLNQRPVARDVEGQLSLADRASLASRPRETARFPPAVRADRRSRIRRRRRVRFRASDGSGGPLRRGEKGPRSRGPIPDAGPARAARRAGAAIRAAANPSGPRWGASAADPRARRSRFRPPAARRWATRRSTRRGWPASVPGGPWRTRGYPPGACQPRQIVGISRPFIRPQAVSWGWRLRPSFWQRSPNEGRDPMCGPMCGWRWPQTGILGMPRKLW